MQSATAIAHPNIALIKYWGDRDADLHIPANSSISMNLGGLYTRTTVAFSTDLTYDNIIINGQPAEESARLRVSQFLDRFRKLYRINGFFDIDTVNNFPSGAGFGFCRTQPGCEHCQRFASQRG
jgi:diphosphomevalonate decarboxylase